ncbi:MAG: glycosyltransferase family 39 protein [Gallionellaceae bacterium]|nr:glycosyltransferase family 39 protein [Gallionellaceae bacterium]
MTIMPNTPARNFWLLFALAALSLLPALNFYYVGEEAIFPITSLEMWQRGAWLKQYLYGMDVQHNPLFNWLIMLVSALAGWEHMLTVTRALTICATLTTGLLVAWLAQRLFRDKAFAAFAALAYITMLDMLLYHGWLSYVDPLFAMFIFAAVSTLWVGTHERRMALLLAAGILLTCAFLSKAFTAYLFYGAALFVLLFDAGQRAFLLRRSALLIHAVMFAAPLGWFALIPSGNLQSGRMFAEILYKLAFPEMGAYLTRLVTYPLEIFIWLSPVTLLAAYFWVRRRNRKDDDESQRLFKTACWIVLLEFLPYWLSPQGGMRYLLPIYPLLALIAARVVWQSGEAALATARKWMTGALALNFVLALAAFPYYQSHYRGKNYDDAAADILTLTQGYPLYSANTSASGLSVTAYLDQRRHPAPAVQWPPGQWQSGYVLALGDDAMLGKVYKKYQLGGDELYLLCRGEACRK